MSLVIHYEKGKLIKAERLYERTAPSPLYAAKDGKTFIMGEIFGASYEDVSNSNWRENPDVLNDFEGALSVVYADDEGCAFASDINGIEAWYTYHKDDTFVLSDNFWDIVKIVQPTYEDIDEEQARLSLVMLSITGETLIKNLKTVFPSSIGNFSAATNQLEVRKYREFKYTNEISDVDAAVEHMDSILDNAMRYIRQTCGDVKYGIGVSGGLDSRVIPHYAKKHGMDIVGFNICVPKPHGVFLARSCKNAKQIADAFQIPYHNTRWNPTTVEQKIQTYVQYYPLGSGRNSFKYEQQIPEFDVLLTGASGLVVGSMLPVGINGFSREELIAEMSAMFNKDENCRTFISRAARGLNYIFGTKFHSISKSAICKLVSPDDIQTAQSGIADFIDSGLKNGQTNIEIYEDFFTNVMGFRNRYGAYESIFGTKRSFSIYVPFMMKEVLKWTPELLFNRIVLDTLIVQKVSEVKDIKSELFAPAPDKKTTLLNKFANMVEFLVRGNGAAVDDYWMKKGSVKKKLALRLDNGCTWFEKIFSTDSKTLKSVVLKSGESELMIDTWELKALVDCLETKEYMNFNFSEEK